MAARPLLRLEKLRVTKSTGEQLLTVEEFTLTAGETVAIIGNSGAGKTLLAKAAVGLLPPQLRSTSSHHELCGVTVSGSNTATARKLAAVRARAVGYINQDAQSALDPLRSIFHAITEQPREQRRRAAKNQRGQLPREGQLRDLANRALRAAGFQNLDRAASAQLLKNKPGALSGGMRQRALIAAALAAKPQLLVADEPTSALDPHIAAAVMRELVAASSGTALLLISHDLAAVQAYADRVLVLAAGQVVEQGTPAQLITAPQHPVTQALVAATRDAGQALPLPLPQNTAAPATERVAVPGSKLGSQQAAKSYSFSLQQAGYRRGQPVLEALSVQIPQGRCVAFIGPSGSGKSTAAKTLLGLVPYVTGLRCSHAIKIAWVPQDTRSSLLPRVTVKQVLREAKPQATATDISWLLTAVDLSASLDTRVAQLSGGQVQRLAIARALARDPELLVLDEPVSALDASVRQTIVELLQRISARKNLSLLLISHELTSVAQLADEVYVFAGGKIVERGSTATIFTQPHSTAAQQMLLEYNSTR